MTVDEYLLFNHNSQYNHACSNDIDGFFVMCDTPDVEPIDISEANSCNLFVIGVVEDKEKLKIF